MRKKKKKVAKHKPTLSAETKLANISPLLPVPLGDLRSCRQSVGSARRQMALNPITQLPTQSLHFTLFARKCAGV